MAPKKTVSQIFWCHLERVTSISVSKTKNTGNLTAETTTESEDCYSHSSDLLCIKLLSLVDKFKRPPPYEVINELF